MTTELKARILGYRGEMERLSFWRELEATADWNAPMRQIRLEQGSAIFNQFEHQLAEYAARGEIQPALPLNQTAPLVTIIFDGSRIPHEMMPPIDSTTVIALPACPPISVSAAERQT